LWRIMEVEMEMGKGRPSHIISRSDRRLSDNVR
jgi:hypothetical protein